MLMYRIFYILLLVGYGGLIYYNPDLRGKIVSILFLLGNAVLFIK
jgi:hypothetical protein